MKFKMFRNKGRRYVVVSSGPIYRAGVTLYLRAVDEEESEIFPMTVSLSTWASLPEIHLVEARP